MKAYVVTNSEGVEMTVQVHDDDEPPANSVPAAEPKSKARKPANKAKGASNK